MMQQSLLGEALCQWIVQGSYKERGTPNTEEPDESKGHQVEVVGKLEECKEKQYCKNKRVLRYL